MEMSTVIASRQQDEISVLESIFNEEELVRSDQHGTSAGQFCAYIEVQDNFHIVYKSHQTIVNTLPPILHLPPIVLHYSLPDDYPINPNSPPTFTLTCHWLSREKLSKLCKELDRLWEENKGCDDQGNEVLYTWAQFLKAESLAFLDLPYNTLDITSIERIYLLTSNCKSEQVPSSPKRSRSREDVNIDTSIGLEDVSFDSTSRPTGPIMRSSNAGRPIDFEVEKCNVACGSPAEKTPNKLRHASPELDCRAVLDLSLNSSLEQYLVEYNKEKLKGVFSRQHHTCNICFLNKQGANCTIFTPCGHIFCVECSNSYFSLKIGEGQVLNILCPESKCTSDAQFNQIKEIISPDLFNKYDEMLLEATLNAMGDIITCPRPECQYSVSRDGDDKLANCFRCRYAFCVDCRMGYHGVEPCRFKSAEEERLVEEYNEGTEDQRLVLEKRYSKRRLENLVENSLTKAWINDNSKNCPHCNAAIQKTFGCNKMVCWKCGSHFCWICSTRLDARFPYLHFTLVTSKCYQLLFHGIDQDGDAPPDEEYLDELEEEEDDIDIDIEEEDRLARIGFYN